MAYDIQQIRQAAAGGFARLNLETGTLVTGGKGLSGKVVAWFREKLEPGKVAMEHSGAMNAFIRAIGADPHYGPSFADMASDQLSPLLQSGKPLDKRVVANVLQRLDAARDSYRQSNELMVTRFASTAEGGLGETFTSLWHEHATLNGLPTDAGPFNTAGLREAIRGDIEAAGDNGRKLVSAAEAKSIASARIEAFINDRTDALRKMDGYAETAAERHALRQSVLQREALVSHPERQTETVRLRRYLQDDFAADFARLATAHGLGDRAGQCNTERLAYGINLMSSLGSSRTEPPSTSELRGLVETRINRFLDGKQQALEYVGSLGLPESARAALEHQVLARPEIKGAEYVKQTVNLAATTNQYVADLQRPGVAAHLQALQTYQKGLDAAFAPLWESESGANDVTNFIHGGADLWAALHASPENAEILRAARAAIAGEDARSLLNGLAFLGQEDPSLRGLEIRANGLRDAIGHAASTALGLPRTGYEEADSSGITGADALPDALVTLARDAGVELALPSPVGRQDAATFGKAFTEAYLESANKDVRTPTRMEGGITTQMFRDLRHNAIVLGGVQVDPSLTSEQKRDAIVAFFGDDAAGREAVSRVMHQGMLNQITLNIVSGLGPFVATPAIVDPQSTYAVSRTDDGSYLVTADLHGPVNALNLHNGAMPTSLDAATSRFATTVRLLIPRDGLDANAPYARLESPIEYSYAFHTPQ